MGILLIAAGGAVPYLQLVAGLGGCANGRSPAVRQLVPHADRAVVRLRQQRLGAIAAVAVTRL